MIAVSSHRPHKDCTFEVWRNQIDAHRSWEHTFQCIVYFGPEDGNLSGPTTRFLDCDPFPTIKSMSEFCASFSGLSCIINADIVILSDKFRTVEQELLRIKAKSATSFRYEFDPSDPNDPHTKAFNRDMGLDIFCAKQEVWQKASESIPEFYRIGHGCWDNWMAGFFHIEGQPSFDFSGIPCILHPKHEDRLHPFSDTVRPDQYPDKYFAASRPPKLKLKNLPVVDIRRPMANR